MAFRDDQLIYSSDWEIDQLIKTDTVSLNVPTASYPAVYVPVAPISVQFSGMPVVDGTWSKDGGVTWLQIGDPAIGGLYLDVTSSQIQLKCAYTTATSILLRYYLYADKVDY